MRLNFVMRRRYIGVYLHESSSSSTGVIGDVLRRLSARISRLNGCKGIRISREYTVKSMASAERYTRAFFLIRRHTQEFGDGINGTA